MPISTEQRVESDKYLEWRGLKKELVVQFAQDNDRRCIQKLRKMMLIANRNLYDVQDSRYN